MDSLGYEHLLPCWSTQEEEKKCHVVYVEKVHVGGFWEEVSEVT